MENKVSKWAMDLSVMPDCIMHTMMHEKYCNHQSGKQTAYSKPTGFKSPPKDPEMTNPGYNNWSWQNRRKASWFICKNKTQVVIPGFIRFYLSSCLIIYAVSHLVISFLGWKYLEPNWSFQVYVELKIRLAWTIWSLVRSL